MIFNSLEYALFLPLVLTVYWRTSHRRQLIILAIASYVFYGWWDVRFLGLIAASTLVDFFVGRAIAIASTEARRRRLLLTSIACNLGVLAGFKYFDFFTQSAVGALSALGLEASGPTVDILLPVGVSFYTFQTISYSFDVFRRRIEPTQDLLTFAVYVAFFPQLVAGPIERARHLLPQLSRPRACPDVPVVASGLLLILRGLVRKVVLADGLAPHVNSAFQDPASAGAVTLAVGVLGFAVQIYGDFAGYTDIARGSARLLGVDLMRNFEEPYLSRDITEFWRRWHISLSTWLRDYLYVPLGGNRRGTRTTYRNLLVTMVLGGLWHGAAWTFVAWGAFHGLLLAGHRMIAAPERTRSGGGLPALRDLPRILTTFAIVCVGWIFFRAESFSDAHQVIVGILSMRGGDVDVSAVSTLLLLGGASVGLDLVQRNLDRRPVPQVPPEIIGMVVGASIAGLVLFSGGDPVPFIYFQF